MGKVEEPNGRLGNHRMDPQTTTTNTITSTTTTTTTTTTTITTTTKITTTGDWEIIVWIHKVC